ESEAVQRAAELRCMSFYLASAIQANQMLYPSHYAPSELPVEGGVEPVAFTNCTQAKSWFDRERVNLLAMARHANTQGLHDHVWRLVDAITTFFDRHGSYGDSRTAGDLAASSARMMGDHFGEASSLIGLGMVHMILGDQTQARQAIEA